MGYFGLPYLYYYGLCLFLALVTRVFFFNANLGRGNKRTCPLLPPGPWQLPVIGSLHHLLRGGRLVHHTLRDLSRRHGPLTLLRLCELTAVVVSSAEAAREVLKAHDAAFAQRPRSLGVDQLSEHGQGVVFAPYGGHWRLLRRVLMTELLSARRVEAFRRIREGEAARLVASMAAAASSPRPGEPVGVDARLEEFVADSSVRAIMGDTLPPGERAAFLRAVKDGHDPSWLFGLRDLFPSSRLVRMLPRRSGGKAKRYVQDMFRLVDDILAKHGERTAAGRGGEQGMMDVLLRIQKEGDMRASLTSGVIRAMLTDVVGAALDSSATTLQWAMAELVANPRVMQKAQLELRQVMAGRQRVHEAALSDIHYLKAVIKETLRLHPPAPFFPRLCSEDTKIQGYDVPRGTIVLVNAWAISRDPKYWEDPDEFIPERFETDGAFDYKGFDFEFTPFGAGRRMCPGLNFARVNIELALASLLYHFDWMLPAGVHDVDMTEVAGISVRRKTNLLLHPVQCIPLVSE